MIIETIRIGVKDMTTDFVSLTDLEKSELVERAYEIAYKYEQEYGNCPQCVIGAIQDVFGIIDDSVFKASHGLAGGVGLGSHGNCGAITGAVMIISSLQGRERADFASGRNRKNYKLSKEMADKFEGKYGGILCKEIQTRIMGKSFDLNIKDEFEAFEEAGGHDDKCPEVVGTAARYIAELIVSGKI